MINRKLVESEFKDLFENSEQSEFVYFKGRRRVGKSTLLKKVSQENPYIFYFMGYKDERYVHLLSRFAEEWEQFTARNKLTEIKLERLSLTKIFEEITSYIKSHPTRRVGLFFDEIQWLAKGQNGFIGIIKQYWVEWERLQNTIVIICGSSQKFFMEQTGGEEKLLRGLRTRADIHLKSLSLAEVKKHYVPRWSQTEIALLYMMMGGLPYYWNQVPQSIPFLQAINSIFFHKNSIFINEIDELLGLEFNKKGLINVKKILLNIGPSGTTQNALLKKSRLPPSSISEILEKLFQYKIICKDDSKVFWIQDPFINFYFQILYKYQKLIKSNLDNSFMANELFPSHSAYYIPQFSGQAFERLVRYVVESSLSSKNPLFKSLFLPDVNFEISFDHLQRNKNSNEHHATDILIYHPKDRTTRIIECKWTHNPQIIKDGIEQLAMKSLNQENINVAKFLITNCKLTPSLEKIAAKRSIKLLSLDTLFF